MSILFGKRWISCPSQTLIWSKVGVANNHHSYLRWAKRVTSYFRRVPKFNFTYPRHPGEYRTLRFGVLDRYILGVPVIPSLPSPSVSVVALDVKGSFRSEITPSESHLSEAGLFEKISIYNDRLRWVPT